MVRVGEGWRMLDKLLLVQKVFVEYHRYMKKY